jgi:hypothetical protein
LSCFNKAAGDVIKFSSHSKMAVLENHYLDKKLITKGREMEMFG